MITCIMTHLHAFYTIFKSNVATARQNSYALGEIKLLLSKMLLEDMIEVQQMDSFERFIPHDITYSRVDRW